MSNPKYINKNLIPKKDKKQVSFRIEKELQKKLLQYANIKGISSAEAITEVLESFFNDMALSNNYLDNINGLYFKIPLDLDIKKEFIRSKQVLNTSDNANIVGDNSKAIKINQIPNNLDVFTAGGYTSNKDGVLHSGIDFIIIKEAIKKPETITLDKLDIDLTDCIYCFYFEVKADNTTDVYLINPVEAVNKLSSANNKITWESLVSAMQQLEDLQNTNNDSYKRSMEQLFKSNKYVSNNSQVEVLNTHLLDIEMYFPAFENENIIISPIASSGKE